MAGMQENEDDLQRAINDIGEGHKVEISAGKTHVFRCKQPVTGKIVVTLQRL